MKRDAASERVEEQDPGSHLVETAHRGACDLDVEHRTRKHVQSLSDIQDTRARSRCHMPTKVDRHVSIDCARASQSPGFAGKDSPKTWADAARDQQLACKHFIKSCKRVVAAERERSRASFD